MEKEEWLESSRRKLGKGRMKEKSEKRKVEIYRVGEMGNESVGEK